MSLSFAAEPTRTSLPPQSRVYARLRGPVIAGYASAIPDHVPAIAVYAPAIPDYVPAIAVYAPATPDRVTAWTV